MTVLGTRPRLSALSRVIARLDQHCEHVLVDTGQSFDYELSEIFFNDLGVRKPDYFLDAAGASAAETIGRIIIALDRVLLNVRPEAMLVLGDTNSSLAVIPAKRRQVPIFHMEAGNRCFDQRVPEEINRRIADHLADINLPYSAIARDYLLREGLRPDLIVKTGSPMFEVLTHYRDRIDASDILDRLGLIEHGYFVASAHREENVDTPLMFEKLVAVLNAVAEDHGLPIIVSCHPRTMKRIEASGVRFHDQVRLMKPLGFHDYVRLQLSARAVLSDSGTIFEEAAILNFPALCLRETHERPEAMEEAAVMMVGLDVTRVRQALSIIDVTKERNTGAFRPVDDYSVPNVSEKVVRVIHSYADYVRRVVWRIPQ